MAASPRFKLEFGGLVADHEFAPRSAGAFQEDPHVGSLDAVHLASARKIGAELTDFVTYDERLARAAEAAGMPVTPAGLIDDGGSCLGRRNG